MALDADHWFLGCALPPKIFRPAPLWVGTWSSCSVRTGLASTSHWRMHPTRVQLAGSLHDQRMRGDD